MKKLLVLNYISILFVCFLVGCSDDDDNKAIKVYGRNKTNQTVYADDTQGSDRVSFKTQGAWTSSISMTQPGEDWIYIDPESGDVADIYTIGIYLKTNYSGEDRSATITIKCKGESAIISVTQKGTEWDGEDEDKSIVLTNPKEQYQQVYGDKLEIMDAIHFNATSRWAVDVIADEKVGEHMYIPGYWIDVDKREGESGDDQVLNIYLSFNDTGRDREAEIVLRSIDYSSRKTIKLVQKATNAQGGTLVDPSPAVEYSKYVSKISINNYSYTTFDYDSKNRLVTTITRFANHAEEPFNKEEFKYTYLGVNKMVKLLRKVDYPETESWFDLQQTYLLNPDGSISETTGYNYQKHSYKNGYLTNVKFYSWEGEGLYTELENIDYQWTDGNLTMWQRSFLREGGRSENVWYEYQSLANSERCNVDMNKILESEYSVNSMSIGNYGGKRSRNMISRQTQEYNDSKRGTSSSKYTYEYSYDTDGQGYVTGIWKKDVTEGAVFTEKRKIATIEYK